jgi:translation elongation factor EF-1alpha
MPVIITNLHRVLVRVTAISDILNKAGKSIESNPSEARPLQTCVLQLQAERPFVAETVHESPRLSRFLIVENRVVVALGFVRRKLI